MKDAEELRTLSKITQLWWLLLLLLLFFLPIVKEGSSYPVMVIVIPLLRMSP